jgi:hypothetical protein
MAHRDARRRGGDGEIGEAAIDGNLPPVIRAFEREPAQLGAVLSPAPLPIARRETCVPPDAA